MSNELEGKVALVTGAAPALRSAGHRLGALGGAGRAATTGRDRTRFRSVLVSAQMAIAVVLAVGAGLMTVNEHIEIDSLVPRAALLAELIHQLPEFAGREGRD